MKVIEICELEVPQKSEKEIVLFEIFKKWISLDCEIPEEVINNYKIALNTLKLK